MIPSKPLLSWWADLHLAATFLTRLPLPALPPLPDGALARSMRAFPVIGAGVGGVGGLVFWGAYGVLPPLAAALLAVMVMVLLTGALHEDGLADTADGLGARGDVERKFQVMRDSRSGAFGVLALVLSVGLRAATLAGMPDGGHGLAVLVAAAALSRAMIPAAMQVMPPARPDGLAAMAGIPHAGLAAWAVVLGVGVAVLSVGWHGALAALMGALAGMAAMVVLARRSFGGYNGDVLGSVQQMAEMGVLMAVMAVWS